MYNLPPNTTGCAYVGRGPGSLIFSLPVTSKSLSVGFARDVVRRMALLPRQFTTGENPKAVRIRVGDHFSVVSPTSHLRGRNNNCTVEAVGRAFLACIASSSR
jgi:hypothetical protein